MLFKGQPVTLDVIRGVMGTPSLDQLTKAQPDEVLEFLRYMVDPLKAGGRRVTFTLSVQNDNRIWRILLRNSVMVISTADSKGATHVDVSRKELAEFVLGQRKPADKALAELDSSLDRSHFILNPFAGNPECVEAQNQAKDAAHGEGEH